jgi:hypothetical protein
VGAARSGQTRIRQKCPVCNWGPSCLGGAWIYLLNIVKYMQVLQISSIVGESWGMGKKANEGGGKG